MEEPERMFIVEPKSDDPCDVEAAALAQRIVDSPLFIEEYRKRYREGIRALIRGEPLRF